MKTRAPLLVLALLVFSAGRASAQVAWDAPWLVPPAVGGGTGLYLTDVHGGGLGAEITWRPRAGSYGLRGGLADAPNDHVGVFGGIDFSGPITRSNYDFPLDVDWVFGAGLGIADWVRLSVPVGVTLGHTFRDQAAGAAFTPYLTPRIFLDAAFNRPPNDDSSADLGFAVDLGLDLRFTSQFLVRFGASMGDREAVAIGLVF